MFGNLNEYSRNVNITRQLSEQTRMKKLSVLCSLTNILDRIKGLQTQRGLQVTYASNTRSMRFVYLALASSKALFYQNERFHSLATFLEMKIGC